MRIDPVACLRCWKVDVDLGPHTLTIPALPARPWLVALVTAGWAGVVPGLIPDVPGEVDDAVLAGAITPADLDRAARAALAASAGCPWWTAERLVYGCADAALCAELTLRGVDPDRTPLAAYLLAGYTAAARGLKPEQRARLDMRLDVPPASAAPEEVFDREAAAAGFMAAMARGA